MKKAPSACSLARLALRLGAGLAVVALASASASLGPAGAAQVRPLRSGARRSGGLRREALAGGGSTSSWTIRSGSRWRTFLVHAPDSPPGGGEMPLLVVFHGHGETASAIAAITGFDRLADADGFLVAYPQGVDRSWNDGRGTTAAARLGVDDVSFTHQVIRQIEQAFPVDRSRVYVAGFSNGGVLVQRLGCELSGEVAAIASVSGLMATSVAPTCHPTRPMPAMLVAGTSDPVMPYAGGTVNSTVGGTVLSAEATVALWASLDGCQSSSRTTFGAAPGDGSAVVLRTFAGCRAGSSVELASVIGGVHTWPGGVQSPPSLLRPGLLGVSLFGLNSGLRAPAPSKAFRATTAIWSFLARQRLVPPVVGRPEGG